MTDLICPCRKLAVEPLPYTTCCKPALEDGVAPPTAEMLMRSRYSAFALGLIDYLHDSLAPEARGDWDRKAATHWSRSAEWLGLDINGIEEGQAGDKTGFVSFTSALRAGRQAHDASRTLEVPL